MRIPRLRRLAPASRLLFTFAFFTLLAGSLSAATLTGRVVDPDGRPVAGARVIVYTVNGAVADRATSSDGRFEIADMPAGEYDVRVMADGFTADPSHVTMGRDERRQVNLQLHVSALTESVVVSASQVDLPLSRSADSVTVITAADLQALQIETVADALRLVPGVTVARSGDRGALTSLFPRGGGSNYTLVLVDGIRANAFGGGFDFGHLAVADVDRIEIVRGPESALFGSDAIGAVVQIVTRRGGRPRFDGLVEGGNEHTMRAAASAAGSGGAWSWGGGMERTQGDGFRGIAPATGEPVTNDDDQLTHGSGSIGWQRADGYDFLVSGNLQRDERGTPGPFGSNPVGAYTHVDRVSRGTNNTRQIGGHVRHPWSERIHQLLAASYTDVASDFTSAFGPSTSGTGRFDGRVQEDVAFSPTLAASAGVEFLRERGSSTYITNAADSPVDVRRSVLGSFAEVRYVGRERLFVTGGARLERLTRDPVPPDAFGSRPAFPDQTLSSFNPKIAVSVLAGGSKQSGWLTRLHASAGTGIRPPNAFEIAFTDNGNLKPERSRSFDAGIEQQVGGGVCVFGATAFLNRYDDLLVTVGQSLQGASRYRTDNISNAQSRGLELSAHARPFRWLTITANYSFLDSEILSVDTLDGIAPPLGTVTTGSTSRAYKVGDPLVRRPRHQGVIDVVHAFGRLTAFGEVTTRSQTLDFEPNFATVAVNGVKTVPLFFSSGFSVVHVGGSVRVARKFDIYARVMNLADRQYEEVFGFPALRRSGIVGIRVGSSR